MNISAMLVRAGGLLGGSDAGASGAADFGGFGALLDRDDGDPRDDILMIMGR